MSSATSASKSGDRAAEQTASAQGKAAQRTVVASTQSGTADTVYVFPSRGTSHKILHLIRHGQATSNAAAGGAKSHPAYASWDYFDAALSPLGEQQAQELGTKLAGLLRPDVILVSPLTRAITTAQGVFGVRQRFLAHDLLRERMGVHPCDKRRPVDDLKKTYKRVDFSLIPHNDDVQWLEKERETPEALVGRIRDFLDWLKSRKEKEIAIVGHSGWFEALMSHVVKSSDPALTRWFENCELRSMHIVFSPTAITAASPPKAHL